MRAVKRRLADEYDAAQERGEVGKRGDFGAVSSARELTPATAADVGLSRKEIHEARMIRDAEVASPGIVRRTVNAAVAAAVAVRPDRAASRSKFCGAAMREIGRSKRDGGGTAAPMIAELPISQTATRPSGQRHGDAPAA